MDKHHEVIRMSEAKANIAENMKRLAGMAGVPINQNPRILNRRHAELIALEAHAKNLDRVTKALQRRLQSRPSIEDLTQFRGIGEATAKQIMELFGE